MTAEQELAELRRTVAYLKDRQEILDCIQRESRARDRQDVELIARCWWEGLFDEHGAVVTFALDCLDKANKGPTMNFNLTSLNITNDIRDLDGHVAHRESYVGLKSGSRRIRACAGGAAPPFGSAFHLGRARPGTQ